MRDELIKVVEDYLNGLRRKDLSRVEFAPDVIFESLRVIQNAVS